jgi:hypothetical protein
MLGTINPALDLSEGHRPGVPDPRHLVRPAVRRLFDERFGNDRVTTGGEFVSVAEGLALIGRGCARAS